MSHAHLTLDLILAPVKPEFEDCARCGVRLAAYWGRASMECMDCKDIDRVSKTEMHMQRGCAATDPAFELYFHVPYRLEAMDPTAHALCAMKLPFTLITLADDLQAACYLEAELDCSMTSPVLLAASFGRYVTHWEGHQPHLLAALPIMRQQHLERNQS